jgi:hypothetical protein
LYYSIGNERSNGYKKLVTKLYIPEESSKPDLATTSEVPSPSEEKGDGDSDDENPELDQYDMSKFNVAFEDDARDRRERSASGSVLLMGKLYGML